MRQFSALVFIILMVSLPSCRFFKEKGLFGKKKKDNIELMLARQDSIRTADSLRKEQDKLVALENARLDSIRLAEEQIISLEGKRKYNIIVGSFYTPEYARTLADVYRQKGYDAEIIQMQGSRFELVVAESFDSFSQAAARLKEFQESVEFDSWMYIKN